MADLDQASVESALEAALGGNNEAPAVPKAQVAPQPQQADADPALAPQTAEADAGVGDPAALIEGEQPAPEEEAAAPVAFEVEYNGTVHKIEGEDAVREHLQKGLDYTFKTEQLAKARDALALQMKAAQEQSMFQQAAMSDIAELQALNAQLSQYEKIDWNAAIDSDFQNAMKLQEQRNTLRARRDAKAQEVNAKVAQFQEGQAQNTQQLLAAESAALLAKLPEWRNSLKSQSEQTKIRSYLSSQGIQPAEMAGLMDHRHLLIARDAMLYRELMANKGQKVKEVRAAPAMVKPGATGQNTGKTDFTKAKQVLQKLGKQGNHRAQEQLVTEMFARTFK